MRKPTLADYHLTQAQIDDAYESEARREVAKSSGLKRVFWLGAIAYGLAILALANDHPKSFGGIVIGGLLLGPISVIAISVLVTKVWNPAWEQPSSQIKDILDRHSEFRAAENRYELDRQRSLETFWSGLSGKEFEQELSTLFRRLGYSVELTRYTRDGGVDINLRRDGKLTIVQCKRYSGRVGVAAARELYGVLRSSHADAAILASTGDFTKGVAEFVAGKPIELLSLKKIVELHRAAGTIN